MSKKLKKILSLLSNPKRIKLFLNRKLAGCMKNYYYKTIKVNPKKILFLTFQGAYTCNPKYICDQIIKEKLPWELIWVVDNMKNEVVVDGFPKQVKLVERNSKEYFRELYSSKIWIDNAFNVTKTPVKKKSEQIYIETMHGSLGIKRIGPQDVDDKRRNKRGYQCGQLTDFIISNSIFEDEVYRMSFWPSNEIWRDGHARNDLFFLHDSQKEIIKTRVYDFYKLDTETNIALYAPTFRDKQQATEYIREDIDFKRLINALEQRFGGQWIVLNRAHQREKGWTKHNGLNTVLDGGLYSDIQELMIAASVGITDYSSWIFDYVLTGKCGFLYAPDLKAYDSVRGFYYPITETPFSVALTNEELEAAVLNYNQKQYAKKVEDFLQEKGCVDDGQSSARIVTRIKSLMEEGK